MDSQKHNDLLTWFRQTRCRIAAGEDTGHMHYLSAESPRPDILLRWREYVRELALETNYYPWFCDACSDLYGRRHIVRVYFEEDLAKDLERRKGDYAKDLEALVRYGFRGASQGGVNGLLLLKYDGDNNVGRSYRSLARSGFSRLRQNPIVADWLRSGQAFEGCKIVSHGRHGNRIVGLINLHDHADRTCGDALLFGVWNYRR